MQHPPGARATFTTLGVPGPMVRALKARGIDDPFPIQAATIPDLLDGRDLCGRAPTGSGKTLAFGIPLVATVHHGGKAQPRRPRGLVLVPTRELAAQVCRELQLLGKPRGPWVEAFYGGTPFPRQVAALRRGVDIAVACPGRLADLINQGCVDLSDVEMVVLDEADRMADMGFLPEVKRLLDRCTSRRQTVLFSATLDGDVQVIVDRYLTDPAVHDIGGDDHHLDRSDHHFWKVQPTDRVATAAKLVHHHGPTMVFCRTKRGADRVSRQLESAGITSAAIHGDRSQSQRDRALRSFHSGQVRALVATDVAARGIHVDGVACVIHYDPPADHKDYVHRSGRTARAGATGVVVTLVVPAMTGAVKRLQRDLELPSGLTVPDPGLPTVVRATPRDDRRPDTTEVDPSPRPKAKRRNGSTQYRGAGSPRRRSGQQRATSPRATSTKRSKAGKNHNRTTGAGTRASSSAGTRTRPGRQGASGRSGRR